MQVIPEGVEEMIDSIHDELRKPSKAAAETSKIAADLRVKKQRRSVQKNAKLTPNLRGTWEGNPRLTS